MGQEAEIVKAIIKIGGKYIMKKIRTTISYDYEFFLRSPLFFLNSSFISSTTFKTKFIL